MSVSLFVFLVTVLRSTPVISEISLFDKNESAWSALMILASTLPDGDFGRFTRPERYSLDILFLQTLSANKMALWLQANPAARD
jgi:hypothetical protein